MPNELRAAGAGFPAEEPVIDADAFTQSEDEHSWPGQRGRPFSRNRGADQPLGHGTVTFGSPPDIRRDRWPSRGNVTDRSCDATSMTPPSPRRSPRLALRASRVSSPTPASSARQWRSRSPESGEYRSSDNRSATQGLRPAEYADQPQGRRRLAFNDAIHPEAALTVATSDRNALLAQRGWRPPVEF
jgi:hypothetical protein